MKQSISWKLFISKMKGVVECVNLPGKSQVLLLLLSLFQISLIQDSMPRINRRSIAENNVYAYGFEGEE